MMRYSTMPTMPPTRPLTAPSRVFLGLTTGASFVLPNSMPPNRAMVSLMNAATSGISTSPAPYSSIRSRSRQLRASGMAAPATRMAHSAVKSISSFLPYSSTMHRNNTTTSAATSQGISPAAAVPAKRS